MLPTERIMNVPREASVVMKVFEVVSWHEMHLIGSSKSSGSTELRPYIVKSSLMYFLSHSDLLRPTNSSQEICTQPYFLSQSNLLKKKTDRQLPKISVP